MPAKKKKTIKRKLTKKGMSAKTAEKFARRASARASRKK
jgi:hypothetical protein